MEQIGHVEGLLGVGQLEELPISGVYFRPPFFESGGNEKILASSYKLCSRAWLPFGNLIIGESGSKRSFFV